MILSRLAPLDLNMLKKVDLIWSKVPLHLVLPHLRAGVVVDGLFHGHSQFPVALDASPFRDRYQHAFHPVQRIAGMEQSVCPRIPVLLQVLGHRNVVIFRVLDLYGRTLLVRQGLLEILPGTPDVPAAAFHELVDEKIQEAF